MATFYEHNFKRCTLYKIIQQMLFRFAGTFYSFTVYMVCLNSVINPFVYAIQYNEFQQRMKEILCSKNLSHEFDSSSHNVNNATVESTIK